MPVRVARWQTRAIDQTSQTIFVPETRQGFRGAAHGGYISGLLAGLLGREAEVTLRRLPPVGRRLKVRRRDERLEAFDGNDLVLEARPADGSPLPDAPAPVSLEAAREASHGFPGGDLYRSACFVCSPHAYSQHIAPGPVGGGDVWATPWTPDERLAGPDGLISSEILWAVSDCPTGWALSPQGRAVVTVRMRVRRLGPVRAGETYALMAWPVSTVRRLRTAGAAVLSPAGETLVQAVCGWLAVDDAYYERLLDGR